MYVPEIESIGRQINTVVERCSECPMGNFKPAMEYDGGFCNLKGRPIESRSNIPDFCPLLYNIDNFPQLIAVARSLVVYPTREMFLPERAIIDWQYGFAGGFRRDLFAAASRADGGNLVNLYKAFPNEILGYTAYGHAEGWWPAVQTKARKLGIL